MSAAVSDLKLLATGKVREMYELEDDLLMVASDRISAYDVVMPNPIPDKGRVLTQMSVFWFETTGEIVPNHLISQDVPAEVEGRALRVKRLEMYPVECVVRGYLSGSGWREYRESGSVCGIELPKGLSESDRLPEPIFTPATKAELGEHDENIAFDAMAGNVGGELAERIRAIALALYGHATSVSERAGIIVADTKFEFGIEPGTGRLLLIDEALTPDSSRFWDAATYVPGRAQASFDKQFVRDWLERQPWDKTAPGPALPDDIVAGTRARYVQAFERITGAGFDRYLAEDVIAS
jgi:phosphoribosylaminoimidazole-succinocarboxamide synthase